MAIDSLGLLRRRIALIERRGGAAHGDPVHGPVHGSACRSTGHRAIDRLLDGGLPAARLHEVFTAEGGEGGSAAGFGIALALLLGGQVLWLREHAAERRGGAIHAAGLAQIGLDPARVIVGVLRDAATTLRAGADAMRCTGLGVVMIELWGNPPALDLTASRRLALAAEGSGVTPLLLRMEAKSTPSAARTRWQVAAAPSIPLAANAPGHPAWDIELLRQRGGPPGGPWRVEWNRDRAQLRDWNEREGPALSGAVVPLPADGPADPVRPSPARRAG